ncbi:uncharacterized protein N7459_005376 [Penicillium hispanicum]|uniref:uncharacterized protein n=1 Tax=Penicillium hispanicum TaxID=1080232 RepID=UPI00253FC2B8|nr:uncharacterized protein N7459_005376 [Penicillium hispanicum]KAJ5585576.1 hypothetical protein N7459_005376 [Penicillium hispanicum]
MDLVLEGSLLNQQSTRSGTSQPSSRGVNSREATLDSTDLRQVSRQCTTTDHQIGLGVLNDGIFASPPKDIIAESVSLYFQYCHKQPLWLFDPDDLSSPKRCRNEVIFGIMALALRYSNNHFLQGRADRMCRQYAEAARSLVMLRITQGTVDLSTMQSLCLIALAEYITNETNLACLHVGLATNLARCGGIDIELHEGEITYELEARRRLFWSIHLLNQQYGLRNMQLNMLRDIHNPSYLALNLDSPRQMGIKPPQVPEETYTPTSKEGIWGYMVQLACLWSEVQHYVSHCASGDPTPPWSVDSGYSIIGAHLMNLETKFPTSHRYDSVRFQDRPREDLHRDRWYWSPWLYLQFTYHAVHSVLNHPFLYSWRPQQPAQLAVPNTFWKTSSELALIHTTWTVRLVEMVSEKGYQISDPYLGHLVAIAATIQIYYCRAADSALRDSAQRKVETCIKFLGDLSMKWPMCEAIYQKLQTLVQSAFATSPNSRSNQSSRRTLSIDTALMWDILLSHTSKTSSPLPAEGLFDVSFLESPGAKPANKVTVETEIFHNSTRTVDTSDGGQGLPPYSSTVHDQVSPECSDHELLVRTHLAPADSSLGPFHVPREPLAGLGAGLSDMSFMDVTRDPFFQFQDHDNPYLGVWEIGNL